LDLSNFRTGNATNMDAMFSGCSGLTRLNLSTFNTSKATYMTNMFYDCSRLTELTVSSFNTENVGYMGDMFKGCSSLTALDLSSFKTANVKAMYGMFSGCSKLTTLDLSNFVTADGINAGDLFKDTQELASIKIGAGFSLDLPQKTGTSVTTGATYSGKWIAQSDKSVYANNAYPKGAVDTYSAQLSYTLSFDTQEGSAPPESKLVVVGDKVAPVGDPEKTGCTFNGWFKEAECINAWIFSKDTMPAHDLTLYASWSTSVLTVTFQTNGGSAIDPAKVDYGAKLTAPTPPLRQGYTFVGWYRDRTLAIPWNFTTDTVTDNIELFAKWAAVVDVDVPIDPRIDIDAKGNVTPGEAATKPFVSRSIKPIAVTEIACATTGTTKLVFPDEAQWLGIKVSVAQPSDPLGGTEIKLGRAVSGRLFEIPAAPLNGTSELPLTFGLEFPAGTSIAY
ncbi:MAG: InlB B-repeat-containing protein, partial [Raoultibacter sp.]